MPIKVGNEEYLQYGEFLAKLETPELRKEIDGACYWLLGLAQKEKVSAAACTFSPESEEIYSIVEEDTEVVTDMRDFLQTIASKGHSLGFPYVLIALLEKDRPRVTFYLIDLSSDHPERPLKCYAEYERKNFPSTEIPFDRILH